VVGNRLRDTPTNIRTAGSPTTQLPINTTTRRTRRPGNSNSLHTAVWTTACRSRRARPTLPCSLIRPARTLQSRCSRVNSLVELSTTFPPTRPLRWVLLPPHITTSTNSNPLVSFPVHPTASTAPPRRACPTHTLPASPISTSLLRQRHPNRRRIPSTRPNTRLQPWMRRTLSTKAPSRGRSRTCAKGDLGKQEHLFSPYPTGCCRMLWN